jgi:hypothetical protein
MNSAIETKVIERFVVKSKRDRYLTFINNYKTRYKFTNELAHFHDLRQELFEEVKGDEKNKFRNGIKNLRNINDCYLISENSELDMKRLDIDKALNLIKNYGEKKCY